MLPPRPAAAALAAVRPDPPIDVVLARAQQAIYRQTLEALGVTSVPLASFAGSLGAVAIVYALATVRRRGLSTDVLLLAVAGGVFAEGVDYPGEMLHGVVVVSPALPQVRFEQERMRLYFEERYGRRRAERQASEVQRRADFLAYEGASKPERLRLAEELLVLAVEFAQAAEAEQDAGEAEQQVRRRQRDRQRHRAVDRLAAFGRGAGLLGRRAGVDGRRWPGPGARPRRRGADTGTKAAASRPVLPPDS